MKAKKNKLQRHQKRQSSIAYRLTARATRSKKRLADMMHEIVAIPEGGAIAYRNYEERATDDAEKLKWRNCGASCKVVAMRIRKAILRWGPEIGLGTIFCSQCNRPLTIPAKYDICSACRLIVPVESLEVRARRKANK